MTSPRFRAKGSRGRWMGWLLGTALVAGPMAACASTAAELYYERTVMAAANARCNLFEPQLAQALAAAQAQARGAALRAGMDPYALTDVRQRAESKAGSTDCRAPDLQMAAGRVRNAFDGYTRLMRMDYPGDVAGWKADRVAAAGSTWRLAQTASFGWDRMTFGLAGKDTPGALVAVATFADGQTPYAARLVMRDGSRAPLPYLDRKQADASGRLPLAARMPPRSLDRAFNAEARDIANPRLLAENQKNGWTFRFPAPAVEALSALDPREAVMVEFLFSGPNGESVRRAYVEVGDFAAGRAFVRYAAR